MYQSLVDTYNFMHMKKKSVIHKIIKLKRIILFYAQDSMQQRNCEKQSYLSYYIRILNGFLLQRCICKKNKTFNTFVKIKTQCKDNYVYHNVFRQNCHHFSHEFSPLLLSEVFWMCA